MKPAERVSKMMYQLLIAGRKDGLAPPCIAKNIDAAYPFDARQGYSYRVWLCIRKQFFATHGLPRKGDYRNAQARTTDLLSSLK